MKRSTPLTLALGFGLLSACGRDKADPPAAEVEPEPTLPSEYTYTPEGEGGATFDAAQVSEALDDFAAAIRSTTGAPGVVAYEAAMAEAEAGCPDWYEMDGSTFWYADCTTSAGATFSGYGFEYLYTDYDLLGDGGSWVATSVYGSARIESPTQGLFQIGGGVAHAEGITGDGWPAWMTQITGGVYGEGEAAQGTWVSTGSTPSLMVYAIDALDYNARYMTIAGTLANVSEAATAIETAGIYVVDFDGYYPCAEEPTGAISVRDAAGRWWTVTFDVVEVNDGFEMQGECDGCGTVTDPTGEVVGEACIDVTPILDWEDNRPW